MVMGFLKDVWLDPRCVWKTHGRQVVEKTAENCLRGMKEFMRTKAGIHQAGKWFLHFGNPSKSVNGLLSAKSEDFFPHTKL